MPSPMISPPNLFMSSYFHASSVASTSLEHDYPSATIDRHRYGSGRCDHLNLVRRLYFEHVRNPRDRATTPPPPPSAIGISSVVVVVVVVVVDVVVVIVVFRPDVMGINRRGFGGSFGNE